MKTGQQILIITILILTIPSTLSILVDKPLNVTISNCYSVNITATLESGAETDVYFVNCNKINNEEFYCKCLNTDNNDFSIIMRTDNYPVHDLRQYKIWIAANYFDINRKTISLPVEDGGDYHKTIPQNWTERTRNKNTIIKTEYVNQTIYINQTEYVPQEVIVYKDRNITITQIEYVNIIQYYENTTKIEEANKNERKYYWLSLIEGIGLIVAFLLLIILSYQYHKLKGE